MIIYDFLCFIRVQRQTGALVAAQNARLYSSQAAEVRPISTCIIHYYFFKPRLCHRVSVTTLRPEQIML